ncbi:MAG: LCP family protein [Marmoricola sp.]
MVVGVLVVVAAIGAFVAVKHLEGNITGMDITHRLGHHRPKEKVTGPVNVLVMGDDTRQGQGPKIGGQTSGLSDTTILLHLSANRKFAYGVSLPRDAMVQRPSCQTKGGGVDPGGLTQFNAAYAIGGPACTIKTVEHLTGVRINHFVVVKFNGFRKMVDAIGGVQVCVPYPVSDPHSNIYFKQGTFNVDGEQALNYVRERHGFGDGSDIGRMKRQQAFIASMVKKVVSAGTLANPVRLYRFLDATTKSLITDPQFAHLGALVSLGSSLKHIGLDKIKFITVPWRPYPSNPNRIEFAPQAKQLWTKIMYDEPIGSSFDQDVVSAAHTPGGSGNGSGASNDPSASPTGSPSRGPGGAASPSAGSSPSQAEIDRAHQDGLCP